MGRAFIDSAGIPTGGGPDWVLLVMVSESRLLMELLAFVPAAVVGSVAGCLVPYYIGRKGGHLVLKRFDDFFQVIFVGHLKPNSRVS